MFKPTFFCLPHPLHQHVKDLSYFPFFWASVSYNLIYLKRYKTCFWGNILETFLGENSISTTFPLPPPPPSHRTPGTIYCFGNRPGTFPPKKIKVKDLDLLFTKTLCVAEFPRKSKEKCNPFKLSYHTAHAFRGSGTAINSQSRFWVPSSLSHQQLTFVHRHHRRSWSYQTCLRGLWKCALGSERERKVSSPIRTPPLILLDESPFITSHASHSNQSFQSLNRLRPHLLH